VRDRVLAGFIAGILAAIGADIANWIFFLTGFSQVRFLDWASRIFLGYLPATTEAIIITQAVQIVWDGLIGVLFVMLIPLIDSRYLVFKGIMFAVAIFFTFRAITVIYNVAPLNSLSLNSFLSNVACSLIWGLLAAFFIERFHADL